MHRLSMDRIQHRTSCLVGREMTLAIVNQVWAGVRVSVGDLGVRLPGHINNTLRDTSLIREAWRNTEASKRR